MALKLAKMLEPAQGAVKERQPEVNSGPRIAFVGDFPYNSTNDTALTRSEYAFLFRLCKDAGINLNNCFLSNVLNFFPTKEHFTQEKKTVHINKQNASVADGIARLNFALTSWKPDVIIFLGRETMATLKGWYCKLDDERGSPFTYTIDGKDYAAIATYHPKELFVEYKYSSLAAYDLGKALRYAKHGVPDKTFLLNYLPSFSEACVVLDKMLEEKTFLAVDIETNYHKGKPRYEFNTVTCMCLCWSTTEGIVIPFVKQKERYWPEDQEVILWKKLSAVLTACPLVGHNAVHFDHNHLLQHYGIDANFVDDTMYAQWIYSQDWPKSLSFTNSLFGDVPYWKGELGASRSGALAYYREYEYCGKDGCLTLAAREALAPQRESFYYNFAICNSRAFQYMGLLGAKIDRELLETKIAAKKKEALALMQQFSLESGKEHADIFSSKPKGFSVRSPKAMTEWLYNELRLPPEYKRVKSAFGETEEHETADYLSLLYLGRNYPCYPAVLTAGKLRRVLKNLSSLESIQTRPGDIVGWSFNGVGTTSGRASGYKPNDRKGVQPQNVAREDRDLYIPALADHDWYKADLEGADAWTVAAILQSLGFDNMMNDLLSGLKPAQRVAIAITLGDTFMNASPDTVKEHLALLKTPEGKITYAIAKSVSHGTNYKMKTPTMRDGIFKRSDGELFVDEDICKRQQNMLLDYYNLSAFHDKLTNLMHFSGELTTCVGLTRKFLDRKGSSLAREMMSMLPQFYTALTTMTVCNRLFYSPINRTPNDDFVIKQCNMVHDETDFIAPYADRDKVAEIFYSVNKVPITCEGVTFTIPFDAERGSNWGNCKEPVHA